ncbi:MAG: heavy metal translocating P-type ATPase, partial [Planctomycetes bacterium]|nr:heavy metal translocating P-type ATPase [Planctomycetota bacterium]
TAIMVATGRGAELGILIKGGEPLEMAGKIKRIVFDKTGTLTKGKPEITDIISFSDSIDDNEIFRLAASLEQKSEHALAEAVYNYAKIKKLTFVEVNDFKAIPGQGVSGFINNQKYFLGNNKLVKAISKEQTERITFLEKQGKTVMILAIEKQVLGAIAVADTVKPEAKEALLRLNKMGLEIYMITGDNYRTAGAIAKELGITNVLAEVLPEDKSSEIKKLQNNGFKVAMVGDGINDAPALAQADLGIAMASGTDIAMESGNIVLMKNDIRDVETAFKLSRAAINKIKQNLFFALFYNVVGIPIATRLFSQFGFVLQPELAGLAMALSSVSVVSNSLFLKSFKQNKKLLFSQVAPFIMIIFFSFLFWQFTNLSTAMAGMSEIYVPKVIRNEAGLYLSQGKAKIDYRKNEPKFFVGQELWNNKLALQEGRGLLNDNEMVLGFFEAQMMKREKLFKYPGDELKDFFGLNNVKIVGILKPTGTVLDYVHLVNMSTFEKMTGSADIQMAFSKGETKLFYITTPENIPVIFRQQIKNEDLNLVGYDNDLSYHSLMIGYKEAQMMKREKLIKGVGDVLVNLFGNKVLVTKILPLSGTLLDHLHFVDKGFVVKAE